MRIPLKAVLRELNRRGDVRFAVDEIYDKPALEKRIYDWYFEISKVYS